MRVPRSCEINLAAHSTVVVTYRKAHIRVAEVLFDGQYMNTADADVVRYRFCPTAVPGSRCSKSYTLWLNLHDKPKHLFANMSRSTRSQIRRAEREAFCYEFRPNPNTAWTEQFFDFYDAFAQSKRLVRSVDRSRVLALVKQGVLDLSRVSSPDGRVLVWHANLRKPPYAGCLYSASLFRHQQKKMAAYIGRANRLHHWLDMLRFRDAGACIYDFGGWYPGTHSKALLRVNRFKESFGGELVVQYNCDQGVTWKGALGLWFAGFLNPMRSTSI